MLELLHHAYYSSSPTLCPPAFPGRTIFTTPVICAPVILPPLTGTVNRACLSCWLGPGPGLKLRRRAAFEPGGGGWREGRRARVGCNELAAMQQCGGVHLNSCRKGRRCNDTKQMFCIPYSRRPPQPVNLFVCFTQSQSFSGFLTSDAADLGRALH